MKKCKLQELIDLWLGAELNRRQYHWYLVGSRIGRREPCRFRRTQFYGARRLSRLDKPLEKIRRESHRRVLSYQ
jgi:hypothetical protein